MTYVGIPYNLEVQIDPLTSSLKLKINLRMNPKRITSISEFEKLNKNQDTLKCLSDMYTHHNVSKAYPCPMCIE